jgi:hypothetical protein
MQTRFNQLLAAAVAADSWRVKIAADSSGGGGADYAWRDLTWGRKVEVAPPLDLVITKPGQASDLSFTEQNVPLISRRGADIISGIVRNEVEFIPANVNGESDKYLLMNIISVIQCLDEARTAYIKKWDAASFRPERTGGYQMLWGVAVDPVAAGDHNLFRLGGHKSVIIASDRLKNAFELAHLTGAEFRPV